MTRHIIAIAIIALLAVTAGGFILSSGSPSVVERHEEAEDSAEHDEQEDEERHIEMSDADAKRAGLSTDIAGAASIYEMLSAMGRINLDPSAIAHVAARFPGTVRELRTAVGKNVRAGETLAVVESNDSLRQYPLKTTISGMVVRINGNVGGVTGESPLIEVVDPSRLWAEFHIFSRDISRVTAEQPVRVHAVDADVVADTHIQTVLPMADESTQSVIARAPIDNALGIWRPGISVRGEIAIATHDVAVAVHAAAIQTLEGEAVVFVREGDAFEVRDVTIGASDGQWTEITNGLEPGESYVSANSFLLKADLGKSSAEHSH